MGTSNSRNDSSLLDFIIKNPEGAQNIFLGKKPDEIHAVYSMSIDSLDLASAVAAIAGLADCDIRGVADTKFGRGSIFSTFIETINDLDAQLSHQEANAFGAVLGHWMANKPHPKSHYWAQKAISLVADSAATDLDENTPVDPQTLPMMSLLRTCHAQLAQSDRAHHIEPIISGFSSLFMEGKRETVNNIENAMGFLSADVFFPALASKVFSEAVDGESQAWLSLVDIYCLDDVIGHDFKSKFDTSARNLGYDPDSFLFSLCANLLSPVYHQPYTTERIQKFIISNEHLRPRLAGHISGEKEVDFIVKKLNLTIGTLFKKEDMPRSARRALLSGDLNL